MSYMTYAMKIQEERDEAKAEGKVEDIKSLMEKKGWSIDEALDALSIPEMEWNQYKTAILINDCPPEQKSCVLLVVLPLRQH